MTTPAMLQLHKIKKDMKSHRLLATDCSSKNDVVDMGKHSIHTSRWAHGEKQESPSNCSASDRPDHSARLPDTTPWQHFSPTASTGMEAVRHSAASPLVSTRT